MAINILSKRDLNLAQVAKPVVSGTTGTLSHNPGSYVDANNVTWNYYRWTSGSGTISLSSPGYVRILVVGGGGGGGGNNTAYGGSAGSGGVLDVYQYLAAGTYNVVVGGSGAGSTGTGADGGTSSFNGNAVYCKGGKGSAGNTTPNPGNGLTWNAAGTNDSLTSNITGSNVTYGNPGAGAQTSPAARSANTGDGGYGASTAGGGAAGGSGVVVVAVAT